MSERNTETRMFCTRCFADDMGGSWGAGTIAEVNHCFNCGAGGSCVPMPAWAVEEIRRNASWVGKRYYPHDEDREGGHELKVLRESIGEWPGRKATEYTDRATGEPLWSVEQEQGEGKRISTLVKRLPGDTPQDAIKRSASLLPYVPRA